MMPLLNTHQDGLVRINTTPYNGGRCGKISTWQNAARNFPQLNVGPPRGDGGRMPDGRWTEDGPAHNKRGIAPARPQQAKNSTHQTTTSEE